MRHIKEQSKGNYGYAHTNAHNNNNNGRARTSSKAAAAQTLPSRPWKSKAQNCQQSSSQLCKIKLK